MFAFRSHGCELALYKSRLLMAFFEPPKLSRLRFHHVAIARGSNVEVYILVSTQMFNSSLTSA